MLGLAQKQRPLWPILLACAAMSDCKDEEVKGEKEEVEDEWPDWRNDDEWPQYDEESMEEVGISLQLTLTSMEGTLRSDCHQMDPASWMR